MARINSWVLHYHVGNNALITARFDADVVEYKDGFVIFAQKNTGRVHAYNATYVHSYFNDEPDGQ